MKEDAYAIRTYLPVEVAIRRKKLAKGQIRANNFSAGFGWVCFEVGSTMLKVKLSAFNHRSHVLPLRGFRPALAKRERRSGASAGGAPSIVMAEASIVKPALTIESAKPSLKGKRMIAVFAPAGRFT